MRSIKLACPKTLTPFGLMFYPGVLVQVRLKSGKYQSIEFILDSGADCTVVPHYFASMTGNRLPRKPDAYMTGIAGIDMPCYKGNMSLKIKNQEINVRCLFTKLDSTPFLIGRIDFFAAFKIIFDGDECNIQLIRRKPEPAH